MTAQQALLQPLFLHVLYTMGLGLVTANARRKALALGRAQLNEIVLDIRTWPDDVRKLGNNFDNQFQMPMLWYAVVAFTLILGLAGTVPIILAWAFLLARLLHSFIHVGRNILIPRFAAFLLSAIILSAHWLWLAFQVFA
jgi:hypothetical protein